MNQNDFFLIQYYSVFIKTGYCHGWSIDCSFDIIYLINYSIFRQTIKLHLIYYLYY